MTSTWQLPSKHLCVPDGAKMVGFDACRSTRNRRPLQQQQSHVTAPLFFAYIPSSWHFVPLKYIPSPALQVTLPCSDLDSLTLSCSPPAVGVLSAGISEDVLSAGGVTST